MSRKRLGFSTAFLLTAAIYGVGAIAWLFIDPVTPLEKEPDQNETRVAGQR